MKTPPILFVDFFASVAGVLFALFTRTFYNSETKPPRISIFCFHDLVHQLTILMSSILMFVMFCSLVSNTMALRCFHCSHTNIQSATKGIHDRIESSPEHCAVQNTCEGKWCVTSLSGNNVSFSCTDRAPVEYFWHEDQINSYCTAAYDDRSVAHATCWCRTHDFCLTNGTRTIAWIGGLILSTIILLFQRL